MDNYNGTSIQEITLNFTANIMDKCDNPKAVDFINWLNTNFLQDKNSNE